MTRLGSLALAALLLAGCSVPRWVPWLGTKTRSSGAAAPTSVVPARPPAVLSPVAPVPPPAAVDDGPVTDRIVAVVNNDAITLSEIQEAIAVYRYENRDRVVEPTDELVRQFLTRKIDSRLQLQEAAREKIVVEDAEVEAELAERMKRLNLTDPAQFEAALKAQGVTADAVKRRIRESLLIARVVRRKVGLRVSVTDSEVERYLAENRAKLETGLAYHAGHILVLPEADTDAAWEAARIKAELIRAELARGADFAALARQHSRDASARDGGDLGTLKRGELARDIEERILGLAPGEVSPPYRSRLGYHIFKLESKEELAGEALTRIKQQIRDILFKQKYEVRLEAWLKEIKERAIIDIRL